MSLPEQLRIRREEIEAALALIEGDKRHFYMNTPLRMKMLCATLKEAEDALTEHGILGVGLVPEEPTQPISKHRGPNFGDGSAYNGGAAQRGGHEESGRRKAGAPATGAGVREAGGEESWERDFG